MQSDLNRRKNTIAPSYIFAKSDSIIISITGPDFFKRNFTLVKDGFFTEDDDPNIPSAFSLRYSSPNSYPEDVVYSVLYKFSIPGKNWINEPIRFNFDSAGNILYGIPEGIPQYLHYPDSCIFNVNKEQAVAIARQAKFEEGYGAWKIRFGLIQWTSIRKYAWAIENCMTPNCGCPSNGHTILIDPNTGVIFQKSDWICYSVKTLTSRPLLPNQSLKLTEPAVDDFARAKQPVTIGRDLARADWLPSLRRFAAAA